ncbi:MAG: ATP-binding protein [Akkermansiaceae bacterium]|nr:ATP-binding protein [Akkermansiaceae bacterium]
MKRHLTETLKKWKTKADRKPLLILGARQVGKTWLMQEFGKAEYKQVVYIRFDRNTRVHRIFAESNLNMKELLADIQTEMEVKITPNHTLLILDEIQECPAALTALKYFCEDLPEYHVMAAGSLLGVHQHHGTGFPVGKVQTLHLYPMNFREFLEAMGKHELVQLLNSHNWAKIALFNDKFEHLLKSYYCVGGMPEAVNKYVETENYAEVREIQLNILSDYNNDFSKHVPATLATKLSLLWNSVPMQLSKENKRFVYGNVQKNMRSKDLEAAMDWLHRAGLVHLVHRVNTPSLPLGAYHDGAFKLFFADIGLLAAKVNLRPSVILNHNEIFKEFKGALTEQYVQQELRASGTTELHYWHAETTHTELDFMLQADMNVVPLEVKAEHNTKAKSLLNYCRRYTPPLAVRASMNDYAVNSLQTNGNQQTTLLDIPLYAISLLTTEAEKALLQRQEALH